MSSQKISTNSYIPPYVSPNLKWYESDGLLTYIDRLKYEQFEKDRDLYLKNACITNFDIIHHECRGGKLEKTYREHKTVCKKSFDKMPLLDEQKALGACFRSERKDLHVKRKLMIAYFKSL